MLSLMLLYAPLLLSRAPPQPRPAFLLFVLVVEVSYGIILVKCG